MQPQLTSCLEGEFVCAVTANAEACCEACGLDARCRGWTFVIATSECWLQGCVAHSPCLSHAGDLVWCAAFLILHLTNLCGVPSENNLAPSTPVSNAPIRAARPWNDPCCVSGRQPSAMASADAAGLSVQV